MTPSSALAFSLLFDPWIPVLRRDGQARRIGIREALLDSGSVRQIAASNPMDNVALVRFLLAVLIWCKPNLSEHDCQHLDGAVGVPEEWLAKLSEHEPAFNLLGDAARFYQDASLRGKEPRPIADLLAEFPGADSINHMRHVVHDGSYGLCPACCVLGMLRLSVWAPANRFYPASVNPGSAAYAIAERDNLLLTLLANLPQVTATTGLAPWLTNTPPESPDAVANLAWRPRRMWLNAAHKEGPCANCGRFGVLLASLCNADGWPTRTGEGRTKKFWDADPHLLTDGEPVSLPGLAASVASHSSRFWRAAYRLRGGQAAKVVAIGPVVNKFVFQDATSVSIPSASGRTRADLSGECSDKLRSLLRRVTPNPGRQHPEIHAALVLMTPHAEARVRALLDEPDSAGTDAEFLNDIYQPLVEQVVACTACGSPLRRRAARNKALALLSQCVRGLADKAAQPPVSADASGATPAKPKRGRKTKGQA
ncbi:MAG: type I-E CRISPR-associated protein Cse1/CasA [Phycisphaerales bacterium]|nr:type I-E CRISPR-associated protein Cse1/CasA [Phycisphaerales bacterium]